MVSNFYGRWGHVMAVTGLSGGPVMGSPTLNGSGVLAAGTYNITSATLNTVYLLNAATGSILTNLPQPNNIVFAQPVFAGDHLFVANAGGVPTSFGQLTAYIPSALKASKK
jgi:hypothetical protein